MKRLVAKVGEYEKNGETKGEYVRLGVILSNDNGEYILLDPCVNLAGVLMKQNQFNKKHNKSVMVSIFTAEPQQQGQQQAGDDWDDSINF